MFEDEYLLKVGVCGLMLMEDFYFWEKMMYFDYERIFEWIVYVCGYGVYGFF